MSKKLSWPLLMALLILGSACNQTHKTPGEKRERKVIEERQEEAQEMNDELNKESDLE